jgi:hypothetical protein
MVVGRERMRRPVAWKTALAMAPAADQADLADPLEPCTA